jgi:hypothetical protein
VIVRIRENRMLLVTQPDHARLARVVMEQCAPLAAHPRRDVILRAIAAHDDGWAEEDAAPTVDPATGRVVDFVSAPVAVRQATSQRCVDRLAHDPWAAALNAEHRITVYDRYRSDPEWSVFFAHLEASRAALLRACDGRLDELVADYRFVRLADLISLAFCTGWTEVHRIAGWTVQLIGARVVVIPDAFGGAIVPMEIDAKEVSNRVFRSDPDLRDELRGARTTILRGEVASAGVE